MKSLTIYINEKLVINRNTKMYAEHPKTRDELVKILKERLHEDKNADLNDIDVSDIDDMSFLFYWLDPHNIDISTWDVSNVKDMKDMFLGCKNFNNDLSNWDVSNVETCEVCLTIVVTLTVTCLSGTYAKLKICVGCLTVVNLLKIFLAGIKFEFLQHLSILVLNKTDV